MNLFLTKHFSFTGLCIFMLFQVIMAYGQKVNYVHPIPFVPEQYLCYQTSTPIIIDGKLDDPSWASAPWTKDFVDIEGELKPLPAHRTRVKMLWDSTYFYFAAQLEEPHIWATLSQRDTIIFQDDDFEIFIDPDGDGHNYYEFEMNAYNTVWDLLMLWPYHIGRGPNNVFNWNNPGLTTAVHIQGTINSPADEDEYWSLEVAFPWSALRELAPGRRMPEPGDQWKVNFSRVDWTVDIVEGKYVKRKDASRDRNLPPDNWVWSPTGRIDMHRPETWGIVQFSSENGQQQDKFQPKDADRIKWILWQLYYQQKSFYQEYGQYSEDITRFTLPESSPSYEPKFYVGDATFEITATDDQGTRWHIDHTGRVWK